MTTDWLRDFVEYASSGETSERVAYWVGISTIAGVLRRKVFFDQLPAYQWSPNFYILIVGPAGVKKSTSIGYGMNLLKKVGGINTGADIATWQSLIEYIAEHKEEVVLPDGEVFEMSCVTLPISEFGTFFDPTNRELKDNLTDLWDGKLGTVTKMTKTSGCDEMVNPWINLIAGTTPGWLSENFSDSIIKSGLASRFIFLFESPPPIEKRNPYPKRKSPTIAKQGPILLEHLKKMADYGGEMDLTEEAYEWATQWYFDQCAVENELTRQGLDTGFIIRKQTHLHKLAMIIAVSQGSFPKIELKHMQEAIAKLNDLDKDSEKVISVIGQSKGTAAAHEIVEYLRINGPTEKRQLFSRRFFRTLSYSEFDDAVKSAIQAELIYESDGVAKPMLVPRL